MNKLVKRVTSNRQYVSNLHGERFEDMCRKATAKTLSQPDERVNEQVVSVVNEDPVQSGVPLRDIVDVLKRRLKMENPHKQWLGIILVAKVLQECRARVSVYEDELLQAVAHVQQRPSKRGPEEAQVRARQAAHQLLQSSGAAGQHAVAMAVRGGPVPGGAPGGAVRAGQAAQQGQVVSAEQQRALLIAEVKEQVDTAKNLSELLQELCISATEGGEIDAMDDLIAQASRVQVTLEPVLGQLSALSGFEAEHLMVTALTAADELENAANLAQETAKSSLQGGDAVPAGATPAADPQPMIDLLGDFSPEPAAPGPAADPFAIGAPVVAAAAAPAADPFAVAPVAAPAPAFPPPPAQPYDPFAAAAAAESAPPPPPQPAAAAADPFSMPMASVGAPAPAAALPFGSAPPPQPFPPAAAPHPAAPFAAPTLQPAAPVPVQASASDAFSSMAPFAAPQPAAAQNPFAAAPSPPAVAANPFGAAPAAAASANPFAAAAPTPTPGAAVFGAPPAAGANPFSSAAAPDPNANPFAPSRTQVDDEFDRIFATSGTGLPAAAPTGPAVGRIHADFNALMGPVPLPSHQPQ